MQIIAQDPALATDEGPALLRQRGKRRTKKGATNIEPTHLAAASSGSISRNEATPVITGARGQAEPNEVPGTGDVDATETSTVDCGDTTVDRSEDRTTTHANEASNVHPIENDGSNSDEEAADVASRSPSPDIASNYEETDAARRRRRANRRYVELDTDEEDANLDRDYVDEVMADDNATQAIRREKRGGGGGRGESDDEENDDDDNGDDNNNGIDEVDYQIVPGPLPAEIEARINNLFARTLHEAQSIARDARKKPSQILDMIILSKEKALRKTSLWDKYQAWYSANVENCKKGRSCFTFRCRR